MRTTVLDHLAAVLADLMRDDDRRVLMGEDVRDGGMLGLSRLAMADPELVPRVLPAPLSPSTTLAQAAGMAWNDARPIVILPGAQAMLDGLAGLRASLRASHLSTMPLPLLIVAAVGPGFAIDDEADLPVEASLQTIDGLRVITVSQPEEAGACLRAAAEFWAGEQPTVVLLPRRLCLMPFDPESAQPTLLRPFATPIMRRQGQAATVFTWGAATGTVLTTIERADLDVAVVDVECISPLDRATLVTYAQRTGKLVIVHDGSDRSSIAADLAALFADETIYALDAPIVRVHGQAASCLGEESLLVPSSEAIAHALARVLHPSTIS